MSNILLVLIIIFSSISFANQSETISKDYWSSLDTEAQGLILRESYFLYDNLEEIEFDDQSLPTEFRSVYQMAIRNIQSTLDLLEFEDNHARVGRPTVSSISIFKIEEEMIGMNISFIFQGCDMPNESNPYFEDENTANEAGCNFSDVSWSWVGSFDSKAL